MPDFTNHRDRRHRAVRIEGRLLLERVSVARDGRSHERFRLARPVSVTHPELGLLSIPADHARFETDLTSVPAVFGWLIGSTGAHLPAAVVHDALIAGLEEDRSPVDRRGADRVFGDLLRASGVGPVRRTMMLAAVTLATRVRSGRVALMGVVIHLVVIALGGLWATAALLGVVADPPWMIGQGVSRGVSALLGIALVPVPLALLWGRDRAQGVVTGWALAALLHVNAAVGLLLVLIDRLDRLGRGIDADQSTGGVSLSPSPEAVAASSTADGGTNPSTELNENRRLPSRSGSSSTSTTMI
jgi:hypothetical protein